MVKKDRELIYVLVAIIIILVFIMVFFAVKTYLDYKILRSHRQYFRQPDIGIQPWMNLHSISRDFNISLVDLSKEIHKNITEQDQRLTLESICKKNNLNCTQVIVDLNQLRMK